MKRVFWVLGLMILSVSLFAADITVYGKDGCGLCSGLVSSLEDEGIEFDYVDIYETTDNRYEMWDWVRTADWYKSGSVTLPIVVIDEETVLESPSLSEIQEYTANDQSSASDFGSEYLEIPEDYRVILYGKESHWGCKSMKNELESRGISYTFFDVDEDSAANLQMIQWVRFSPYYDGANVAYTISYPVVVVYSNTVFMNPSIDEVEEEIENPTLKDEDLYADADVVLYGRPTCGLCTSMQTMLDNYSIPYTYYNISEDDEAKSDMFRWACTSEEYNGESLTLPVLVINGEVCLLSPSFDEVIAEIENE